MDKEVKESMTKEQWEKFHNMKNEDIDISDIPEITKEQWNMVEKIMREDRDVLKKLGD